MTDTVAALLVDTRRVLYGEGGTLAVFAARLDVNPRTLRNYLSGKREPDREFLEKVHKILIEAQGLIPRFDAFIGAKHVKGP